jgi:hemolysin activation/secretion protein
MITKTSKTKKFCLTLILIATFSLPAQAQSNQNAINQQDWITRNQQNISEEKKHNDEFETIRKERERKKKEEAESKATSLLNISGKTEKCFPIDSINLTDANSISVRKQNKIVKPFLGKCFKPEILSNIITAITTYYHSKGYATVQVLIPQQNVEKGDFTLQVIEGKIEEIAFGKNKTIEKMQRFMAFGNNEGSVLNINDINQGIYQINRLRSNAAVMKIEPGSNDGDSKIIIENNHKFPASISVSKDNLGNKFTGVQRSTISSNFDNLLFLNDNLNLSYTTNLHDDSQIKNIKSFAGGISIPFKYNTFSYNYYRTEFKGRNPGVNGYSTLTGFSDQRKFTFDRVLLSKIDLKLSANSSLTVKESASYVNDTKIETSERKLSVMNLGFSISSYLNDTTNIYLAPSYSKGLKILNAQQDQKNLTSDTPKSQFEVFKLYASASKRFTIPKTETPITFTTEMNSQLAKQTLFGTEQISVGGYYSVRGFRESYISGDSGYYFRNKANVNIGSLILPFITDNISNNLFTKNLSHLNKFSIEPFYDYGYIKNKYDGSDGRMSGFGFKTIFNSKYFNSSVTFSQGTGKSRLITNSEKENRIIYFEINASCC